MRHTTVEQHGKHRVILALLIAGALALAGCSSPPKTAATTPPVSAPPTSEPATTPAPTPSAAAIYKPATAKGPAENVPVPVLPEKAKEFSKEGLIAFTKYWYSTLGYAFETGDPEPMMTVTGPDCPTCKAMKAAVVPWHTEGRWIVGGQMIVLSVEASFVPLDDGAYQAVAMVRQQNVKYFRGDGTLAEDKGIKPTTGDLFVASYTQGHWMASNVSHLAGSKK